MPPSQVDIADGTLGTFAGSPWDDVVFGHYRRHGTWAPEVLDLLSGRLRDGGTFIDVGANIGLVSIPLANRCPDALVHAIEPAPDNHACLVRNIAHHDCKRVTAHNFAAYSRRDRVPMALSTDNAGDHHLLTATAETNEPTQVQGQRPAGPVWVAADTLDRALGSAALPAPVVMKIDTQGAEVQVLRGASKLLPQVHDLVIEYWPAGLRRCGDRASDLRRLLGSQGHLPYGALLTQDSETPPDLTATASLLERLAFFGDDDPGFFDLWLCRHP